MAKLAFALEPRRQRLRLGSQNGVRMRNRDHALTIVYAHRGAAAERPENTLPSFRRALELGADALETDVHLTADGEIVASHDEDGARMTGVARALRSTTLVEIQSW